MSVARYGNNNEFARLFEMMSKYIFMKKQDLCRTLLNKKDSEIPAYLKDYPEANAVKSGIAMDKIIKHLVKQKKALIDRNAPKELIQAKQDSITAKMKFLNDKVTGYR